MDLLFQCLGSEATKPLASEVSAGDNCPSQCWWLVGGDDSLLVPVATPRELLVTC